MASTTRLLALACALLVSACAGKPDATECATGIVCPAETKCAAVQPICITNNCGDGIQQSTEQCDDGNILDGDGCAADCRSREVCGDNVLNSAAGEICDDGNTLGGDGCASDCRSVEICGNSIRDVGEACDDGNTVPGDGCSGNCKSTEVCGNNIVDINEKCDDGGTPGGCNDDCQGGQGCGDGAIDRDGGGNALEECDDGNGSEFDDCIQCHLASCGDGHWNKDGINVEQCDPGNAGETNDCNLDCTSASCGDGKINKARGEQCDDQNVTDEDACKNSCELNYCGDGVEGGPNEACDDAGDSTNCDIDCTIKDCGDGYVNLAAGEQCDSMGVDSPTCDANCTIPVCGDGTVNMTAGEDCDDMNASNDDACRNDCTANTCGDGFLDALAETCDDHNTMDELACSYGTATCTACNATCSDILDLTGNVCGDGATDATNEVCDDHNTVSEAMSFKCPYGTPSCTMCSADCQDELPRTGPYCGDGTADTTFGEACDDGNASACGTCDAACNKVSSSVAKGYILMVSGAEVTDDDTITMSDGFKTVTFEFDSDASGPSDTNMTNQMITFDAMTTVSMMRMKLRQEINGVSGFNITATDGGGSSLLLLANDRKTSLGNQPIDDTISDSDFVVTPMTGGAGGDCDPGIKCKSDDDCTSGDCASGTCQ